MLDRSDLAVLSSTAALIDTMRRHTFLPYADDTWSPVSSPTVGLAAFRFGAALQESALPHGVQELAIPAYIGDPIVVVNQLLPPPMRALALRHGLAHLIAGELAPGVGAEIRFMSSMHDYTTLEERRADLFALADLLPEREMRNDPDWLAAEISLFAPDWPADRLFDRAALRLALRRY